MDIEKIDSPAQRRMSMNYRLDSSEARCGGDQRRIIPRNLTGCNDQTELP